MQNKFEIAKSAVTDNKPITVDNINYQHTKVHKVEEHTFLNNRIIAASENDARADVFRILRTKILQRMRSNQANVLALTSPSSGAGKSLVAVNLAVSVALDTNYSVLLIDMDLRHPSLHQYFGLTPKYGLSDYCLEDKPLNELLINPGINSLVLLPAGRPTRRSSELLTSTKMLGFFNDIKHRYLNRIIILNLPPLLVTDDALAFMPNVDAFVLVAAEGKTKKNELELSLQLIDQKKYIGTIFNQSTEIQNNAYY